MTKKSTATETTVFKNRPLVRRGSTIYYGNISDKCVAKLDISSEKRLFESTVADGVTVQLLDTNPDLDPRKKLMKRCKRNGLYEAMDVADAWLSKAQTATDEQIL